MREDREGREGSKHILHMEEDVITEMEEAKWGGRKERGVLIEDGWGGKEGEIGGRKEEGGREGGDGEFGRNEGEEGGRKEEIGGVKVSGSGRGDNCDDFWLFTSR